MKPTVQPTMPKISPTMPPGMEGMTTVLGWLLFIGGMIAVAAVILAGIRLMTDNGHGKGEEHGKRLGFVFAGILVLGAAGSIVGALLVFK